MYEYTFSGKLTMRIAILKLFLHLDIILIPKSKMATFGRAKNVNFDKHILFYILSPKIVYEDIFCSFCGKLTMNIVNLISI